MTLGITEIRIGRQGRVVIPASLRKALGVDEGDTLIAHVADDHLVLEKPEAILRRVRKRFSVVPKEVSLVDELIADHLAESQREANE